MRMAVSRAVRLYRAPPGPDNILLPPVPAASASASASAGVSVGMVSSPGVQRKRALLSAATAAAGVGSDADSKWSPAHTKAASGSSAASDVYKRQVGEGAIVAG